jgi:hypothetical protein
VYVTVVRTGQCRKAIKYGKGEITAMQRARAKTGRERDEGNAIQEVRQRSGKSRIGYR